MTADRQIELHSPITETSVRVLRTGDAVTISGTLFTARDRFHRHAADGGSCPVDLRGGVLFHCGPVIVGPPARRRLLAAGPTTSIREEPYMSDMIERFGIRAIIGKGGMGENTLAACARYGCIYIQATGGAAQFLRHRFKSIDAVYFLDTFGPAEALWQFQVDRFPGIVTMDTHGRSLYSRVAIRARKQFKRLIAKGK